MTAHEPNPTSARAYHADDNLAALSAPVSHRSIRRMLAAQILYQIGSPVAQTTIPVLLKGELSRDQKKQLFTVLDHVAERFVAL